ncbi:putative Casein kinase substrate phosphoprotein PP28 domain-containing protein [Seiridium cardinale]
MAPGGSSKPGAASRGRGGKFKKFTRGGGHHFSRDLRPLDADGNEISMWSAGSKNKGSDDDDDSSEEDSEEESSEEDSDDGPSQPAGELTREERKKQKAAQKAAAVARKNKGVVQVGDLPSDSEEESDDDMPANPNHSKAARNQTKAPPRDVEEVTQAVKKLTTNTAGMSRKERESMEAAQAKERYRKLHEAGKTDEAKADLARLALIREKREAEAARKQAEKEEREAQEAARKKEIEAKEAKKREAALGKAGAKKGKRRKTRCNFRSPSDSKCVSCAQRGMPCQSQQHEEPTSLSSCGTTERLARLESLVEKLVYLQPAAQGNDLLREAMVAQIESPDSSAGGPPKDDATEPESHQTESRLTHKPDLFSFNYNPLNYVLDQRDNSLLTLQRISQLLHAQLPCAEDIAEMTGNGHGMAFLSFCYHFKGSDRDPDQILAPFRIPSATSHPVLLARALLQLAFCLQHSVSCSKAPALRLKEPFTVVASQWVQMATKLVTCNDHFIDSVEALHCLLIEGYSLVNTGSLRRAWISFRRALSFAQIMGFHRETATTVKALDPETRYSQAYMWSVIVYQERLLALLIGTPTATKGSYLCDRDMDIGSPSERLGKRHAIIISQLVERNQSKACQDLDILHSIDRNLQDAAATVPVGWWQLPLPNEHMEAIDYAANATHANVQIIHFTLTIYLHLPFLLASDAGPECTGNKLACINASREILRRFNILRGYVKAVFCCRYAEFCAFNAGMTLLLAYIDNIRGGLRDVLEPLRLGDVALITLTMDTMDKLRREHNDAVSGEALEVMKKLFNFYQCALQDDTEFKTYVVGVTIPPPTEPHDKSCRFIVPYYGCICITREEAPGEPQALSVSMQAQNHELHNAGTPSSSMPTLVNPSPDVVRLHHHHDGPPDYGICSQSFDTVAAGSVTSPAANAATSLEADVTRPDFFAEGNDWGLQGVDMTFFSSLIATDTMQHGFG